MSIPYYVDITSDPDIGKLARRFPDIMKTVLTSVALVWHRDMLPLHFKPTSKRRYHYQNRRLGYERRKRNWAKSGRQNIKQGGQSALVYSGTTEDLATGHKTVRAYPTRVTLRMPAPKWITPRRKDPRKPNMHEEVLRVIPNELGPLTKQVRDGLNQEFRRQKVRSVKRIRP